MTTFDLSAFSAAVADLAEEAAPQIAALHVNRWRTASAFYWRDGLFVAPEEVVDPDDKARLTLAGGEIVNADLLGRDPSTGIALLKPEQAINGSGFSKAADARPGNLAIVAARGVEAPLAAFATVSEAGPAWRSMRGGLIARRIRLGLSASGRFEGGAVLDARGGLIGMLLFGQRRSALVIPYETIELSAGALAQKGHVSRGFLGASLQAVRDGGLQGAIVMALDEEGPAKKGGLHVGDVIVTWSGESISGPRGIIRHLGTESVGKEVRLGVMAGGKVREVVVTLGEKPLT